MTSAQGRARWLRATAIVALAASGPFGVFATQSPLGFAQPAASVSALNAQAQAIEAQLASLGASVHALTTSIVQTQATVSADESSEAILQAQLSTEQAAIARDRRILVAAADQQFVSAGQYSSVLAALQANYTAVGLQQGYEEVASSSITQAEASYERARLEAQVTEAELAARIRATEAELASEQQQRAALNQRVGDVEAQLAAVHSQIQAALAAQAAAAPLPAPGGASAAVQVLLAPPGPSASSVSGPATPAQLLALRDCESGGNYQEDTGNGYYGAYQFALSTWLSLGFSGLPSQAPPAVQDQAAEELLARSGWGQWPVCSALLGF